MRMQIQLTQFHEPLEIEIVYHDHDNLEQKVTIETGVYCDKPRACYVDVNDKRVFEQANGYGVYAKQ